MDLAALFNIASPIGEIAIGGRTYPVRQLTAAQAAALETAHPRPAVVYEGDKDSRRVSAASLADVERYAVERDVLTAALALGHTPRNTGASGDGGEVAFTTEHYRHAAPRPEANTAEPTAARAAREQRALWVRLTLGEFAEKVPADVVARVIEVLAAGSKTTAQHAGDEQGKLKVAGAEPG